MINRSMDTLNEKRRSKKSTPNQVKAKEPMPRTVKPNTGPSSPHPYRGRLVGG